MTFLFEYWGQISAAFVVSMILFVLAINVPQRITVGFLILIIPFQFVTSRYGTLNIVLTYVLGISMLMTGRIKSVPMLGTIVLIFVSYSLSLFQSHVQTMFDQIFYMIAIISNFILFIIVYNFFRYRPDAKYALNLLVMMNVLVVIYGLIQITVGFDQFAFFGVSEWAFEKNLETKQRLIGAFGPAGVTGAYYAMQMLAVGYLFIQPARYTKKFFLTVLLLANFGLLVGTGSRGSFLVLLGGVVLFLWFFRREMGLVKIAQNVTIGTLMFSIVAIGMVSLTDFNVLFERLEDTQLEGGIPETRQLAFALGIEGFSEAPILGHGPRLRLMVDRERNLQGYKTIPYPHNLYLFLLYTVGIVGLTVHLLFFFRLAMRYLKAKRPSNEEPLTAGFPRLGLLLLIVFMVDQLKIEYLRVALNDMQHYVFMLLAMFLAFSDSIIAKTNAQRSLRREELRSHAQQTTRVK
jgi:O-antigen ligase